MKTILSGVKPTGDLHLGNYLGAVKGMLALQENPEYETFYMVADLHTLTTPYDQKELKNDIREVVLDYLAAGLDPEKSTLFIQSQVPEHVELSYLFATSVSLARMLHLPTYKEKLKLHPKDSTVALLYYPVLMAADILIYKAESVPTGIDQEPHLEVSREIARKMNSVYGTDFPEPQRFVTEGEYVPALTGEGKMSKSVEGSYVNLTDDLEMIKKRLTGAPTDSGKGEKVPEKGGVANLLTFVGLFRGSKKRDEYEMAYKGSGIRYSELKEGLAKAIYEELKPIQEKRRVFEKDPDLVERILAKGAQRAREVARDTLDETKKKMGLI